MLEGNEGIQQDANFEESSEASQTSNQESATEVSAAESQVQPSAEPQMPFHEHPRFKELIQERNTFKEQIEAMQKQMEALNSQRQQAQQKEHPFVAKLKEIDPQYGEWAGGVEGLKKDLEEMRAWKQEQQRQALVNEYNSSIEKLHSENKVPDNLRDRIKREIDRQAVTNPKLGMKDLPAIYKQVMDEEMKYVESLKRSERASYVADKSKDVKAPQTQTKGAPAGQKTKPAQMDREQMYASVVQRALKHSKAGGDF
jgi:chromosome segregation ATPase